MAVQVAKHIGARVAATASGKGIDYVKGLGADEVIDYKAVKFEDALRGYDAVFDTVGGDNPTRSLKVLKRGGVIACMLNGPDPELAKKAGVTSIGQMTKVTTARLDALRALVEAGAVKAHVDATFPLERIREAFDAKEKGTVIGKLVILIRE